MVIFRFDLRLSKTSWGGWGGELDQWGMHFENCLHKKDLLITLYDTSKMPLKWWLEERDSGLA